MQYFHLKEDQVVSSRTRMHHYLPISFLKRFTNSEGLLHVLDFQDHKLFKLKPEKVAKIHDFYAGETNDNPKDQGVEDLLAFFEAKAAPAFERIISENNIALDSDDWLYACNFIALLDRRLPISREGYKQAADWMMNVLAEAVFGTKDRLEATLKRIEADTGKKLDLDFEGARRLIDEGCISADVPQNTQLRFMLESAMQLGPLIFRMTPHLLIAQDAEFITGDCPLAKRNRQQIGLLSGVGWALPTIEIGMPIGRQHCIVLTWDPEPHVLHADRLSVANMNCQIAQWAMRYVLGSRERFVWMDRDGSVRTGPKLLIRKLKADKEDRQLIQTWPPKTKPSSRKRRRKQTETSGKKSLRQTRQARKQSPLSRSQKRST